MAFNDNHNIDEDWQNLRKFINEIEPDIYKFIGQAKNKKAATRVRKRLIEIRKIASKLRISIGLQRQDNSSMY